MTIELQLHFFLDKNSIKCVIIFIIISNLVKKSFNPIEKLRKKN